MKYTSTHNRFFLGTLILLSSGYSGISNAEWDNYYQAPQDYYGQGHNSPYGYGQYNNYAPQNYYGQGYYDQGNYNQGYNYAPNTYGNQPYVDPWFDDGPGYSSPPNFNTPWNNSGTSFSGPWNNRGSGFNMPWNNRGWGNSGRNPFGSRGFGQWMNPNKHNMADNWDDMLNAPSRMGRMPGGWEAPSISVPNPIDVGDEFGDAARDIPDQMDNFRYNR